MGRDDLVKLSVSNLSASYGRTAALSDVTFDVDQGVLGILGLNGAGKTTLIKAICGLIPHTGKAEIAMPQSDHPLDVLFDNSAAARPRWRVEEYLAFFRTQDKRVGRFPITGPQEVAIEPLLHRAVGGLSAGQRRQVELRRVLESSADIALLDEPTRELDAKAKLDFWEALSAQADAGRVFLVLSHDTMEIQTVCDRALLLQHGRIMRELDCDETHHLTIQSFRELLEDNGA